MYSSINSGFPPGTLGQSWDSTRIGNLSSSSQKTLATLNFRPAFRLGCRTCKQVHAHPATFAFSYQVTSQSPRVASPEGRERFGVCRDCKCWIQQQLRREIGVASVGLQRVLKKSVVAVGLLIKLELSVPQPFSTLREKTTASGVLRTKATAFGTDSSHARVASSHARRPFLALPQPFCLASKSLDRLRLRAACAPAHDSVRGLGSASLRSANHASLLSVTWIPIFLVRPCAR